MAWAFVQDGSTFWDGITPAPPKTTHTVALTSVGADSLIVAWIKHEGAPTTYSVSDGTTTFTAGTVVDHTNLDLSAIFQYLLSANSGNKTYTLTVGASRPNLQFVVKEFSHASSAEFDQQNTGQGNGTSAASGAITTTGANVVCIGGVAAYSSGTQSAHQLGGVAASNLEPAAGPANSQQGIAFDRVATLSGGTATVTVPLDDWICNIIAFKEAAGDTLFAQGVM